MGLMSPHARFTLSAPLARPSPGGGDGEEEKGRLGPRIKSSTKQPFRLSLSPAPQTKDREAETLTLRRPIGSALRHCTRTHAHTAFLLALSLTESKTDFSLSLSLSLFLSFSLSPAAPDCLSPCALSLSLSFLLSSTPKK